MLAGLACAEPIRFASFNTDLARKGPGLLLRDILRGKDAQIAAVIEVITTTAPDVIALQSFDWDYENRALDALADALADAGMAYPYRLSLQPNTGLRTGFDMDGDGRLGEAEDSQSFGRFTGHGGMALLSRVPFDPAEVVDHSALLWSELPDATPPVTDDGTPFPSAAAFAVQRLPHVALWEVPLTLPGRPVLVLFQAAPPVFDGPEDRNGLRNAGELELVADMATRIMSTGPVVLMGGSNLDPFDGEGRHDAVRALLSLPGLIDPAPQSTGAAQAEDEGHKGPNALDTVDWPTIGRFRVDHVLPGGGANVAGAGVYWPAPQTDGHLTALEASRHRLVWVDLTFD